MANFVFNVARGRMRIFFDAIDTNSTAVLPGTGLTSSATSTFVIVLLETTGLEADATLADYDNLSLLIAGTSNEQTNQARKTLDDTVIGPSGETDATNVLDLDIPDIVYTALAGNAISKLLVCFRAATADADTSIIPLTAHDFVVTPDGTDVTAQIAATGFYRSS